MANANNVLEQADAVGLDTVSVDLQFGLLVGLYHPVEQPVVFRALHRW